MTAAAHLERVSRVSGGLLMVGERGPKLVAVGIPDGGIPGVDPCWTCQACASRRECASGKAWSWAIWAYNDPGPRPEREPRRAPPAPLPELEPLDVPVREFVPCAACGRSCPGEWSIEIDEEERPLCNICGDKEIPAIRAMVLAQMRKQRVKAEAAKQQSLF